LRSNRLTVTIACLGLASFGVVFTILGALLPGVMSRFGIDKAQAGTLLAMLSFGVLGGSIVFGPIVDRRGHKSLLVVAFAAIIIGLEATAFAPSLDVLRGAVLLIGFTGGLVNGAVNALTADVSADQRAATMTFVGGFFGVGAAGVPLVLTVFDTVAPTTVLAAVALLVAVPLALTVIATFPPSKQPQGFPVADARRMLRDPALLLMGLILFLESGAEASVGGWLTTYFAEELDVSLARTPLYLALFWGGLMITRLALGVVLRHASAVRVVLFSIAVSLASALVLISSRNVMTAAFAVFVLGCGLAATFPVFLGFVGERYAQLSGTAISVAMSMALVGGMLLPFVAGVIGDARGMRVALLVVPACLLLQAALFPVFLRATKSL
jgi:MFS transporter, FHS family, glucose/mannose:H+ symporter